MRSGALATTSSTATSRIKFLPQRYALDANRLGRFVLEARAASSLNHPNIITIHEVGQAEGLPYIVMELVEGRTLRSLLDAAERPLTARQMLDIAVQVADGLAKAHGGGITHRDLKPENVMVTADGFVKILDFGLAKLRGADGEEDTEVALHSEAPTRPTGWTASGVVMGTVGYMAPEQARGRPVDHRADQFNLGLILYEMASGRQAFRRETPVQTVAAIIEDPPEPLALLNPSLPAPLRWMIERCLAKEPEERYASTLDLARELRGLREHLSEVPSAPSSAAPVPRTRGVSPRMAIAGVVAVILIAAAARYGPAALEWTDRAARAAGGAGGETHRSAAVSDLGRRRRGSCACRRAHRAARRPAGAARALSILALGRAGEQCLPVRRHERRPGGARPSA